MRRPLVLVGLALALLAVAAPAATAPKRDPIEGNWVYLDGLVSVKREGGIFVGRVVKPIRFAACLHERGEQMWTIERVPAGYAGRHQSFDDNIPGCGFDDRVWLPSAWDLRGNRLTIRVARLTGTRPGACGSISTICFELRRAVPRPPARPALVRYSWSARAAGDLDSNVTGAGGFTTRGTEAVSSSGIVTVTRLDEVPDVRLRLLVAGRGTYRQGSATLRFTVRSSSSPFCFVGEAGQIVVSKGRFTLDVCGDKLRFVNDRPPGTIVTTAIHLR